MPQSRPHTETHGNNCLQEVRGQARERALKRPEAKPTPRCVRLLFCAKAPLSLRISAGPSCWVKCVEVGSAAEIPVAVALLPALMAGYDSGADDDDISSSNSSRGSEVCDIPEGVEEPAIAAHLAERVADTPGDDDDAYSEDVGGGSDSEGSS